MPDAIKLIARWKADPVAFVVYNFSVNQITPR